jgi:hypothetical protein
MQIKGLGDLSRMLSEAQRALAGLDGALGTISFDPESPTSLEAAIATMEALIDEKLRGFERNPIIKDLAAATKEHWRQAILDRAAAARLGETGLDA